MQLADAGALRGCYRETVVFLIQGEAAALLNARAAYRNDPNSLRKRAEVPNTGLRAGAITQPLTSWLGKSVEEIVAHLWQVRGIRVDSR